MGPEIQHLKLVPIVILVHRPQTPLRDIPLAGIRAQAWEDGQQRSFLLG